MLYKTKTKSKTKKPLFYLDNIFKKLADFQYGPDKQHRMTLNNIQNTVKNYKNWIKSRKLMVKMRL